MFKESNRSHGLESFIAPESEQNSQAQIKVSIQSNVAHINLRGKIKHRPFLEHMETVLDQKLPVKPNTTNFENHSIYWLGPDEWLILCPLSEAKNLVRKLQGSRGSMHAAVNDVSGGQIALRLDGNHVRDVLAKGCTLDLHPSVFGKGMCAQSNLAKANVLISMGHEPHTFDLIVRRSFSDYLLHWLKVAAAEYTTEWSES